MSYKVGDVVLLYTWEELSNMYTWKYGGVYLPKRGYSWSINEDKNIPKNRIVTLSYFDSSGDPWFNGGTDYIMEEMIKCHVGEYYLQQIKEELCEGG